MYRDAYRGRRIGNEQNKGWQLNLTRDSRDSSPDSIDRRIRHYVPDDMMTQAAILSLGHMVYCIALSDLV